MSVIYCKINMFDFDQTIYTKNDDGTMRVYAKAPYSELDKTLCKTCEIENINEIYLEGNKYFTEGMKDRISKFCSKKYDKSDKITVHLIGENNE